MNINNKNILFVHIPKTGGNTMTYYFGENDKFTFYRHNILKYDIEKYKNYFKLSIIRDPIERICSAYFYSMKVQQREKNNHPLIKDAFKKLEIVDFQTYKNKFGQFFSKYVLPAYAKLKEYNDIDGFLNKYDFVLFFPLHWFICDNNNKILVDKIVNTKNMNNEIGNLFGIKMGEICNTHDMSGKNYRKLFTDQEIESVKKIYEKDYKIFEKYL